MDTIYFSKDGKEKKYEMKYLTMPQLSKELDENYSTIRYWLSMFERFMDVDINSNKKLFNERDVELFKYIQVMIREQKFTIAAVQDYLEDNIDKFKSGVKIDNNPQEEVIINNIVDNRISARLNDFKEEFKVELVEEVSNAVEVKMQNVLMKHFAGIEDLIKENQEINNKKLDEIKSEITTTVVEEVSGTVKEGIENSSKTINETLTRIEEAAKERDLKQAEEMKKMLDQRRKENEELIASMKANEEKKGFFSRMFGK